jgi:hypothetical protein
MAQECGKPARMKRIIQCPEGIAAAQAGLVHHGGLCQACPAWGHMTACCLCCVCAALKSAWTAASETAAPVSAAQASSATFSAKCPCIPAGLEDLETLEVYKFFYHLKLLDAKLQCLKSAFMKFEPRYMHPELTRHAA